MHPQEEANKRSLQSDRSPYWDQHADQVTWFKKPSATIKYSTKTLPSGNSHPHWQWFPDGELNTCYNCVDRHVKRGNGEQPAIFWHSEVANAKEVYSYQRLLEEVEALAGVLRNLGVRKGDTVVIYIPMIPSGTHCFPRRCTLRRYSCCCLRRVWSERTCAEDRLCESEGHAHDVLWTGECDQDR